MIYRAEFNDLARSCVHWASRSAWLSGLKHIEFAPGVNLIYGPNGAGKTSLILAMARMLLCAQGGIQYVTSSGLQDVYAEFGRGAWLDGLLPIHDGAPVMHADPTTAVGLIGGTFDWDFSAEGLANTMTKQSAGQTTSRRLTACISALAGKIPWPEVKWQVKPKQCPEVAKFLEGNHEGDGARWATVLMDEPTKGLDLSSELRFWKGVAMLAKRNNVQVIAATHSVIPLFMPDLHFIETQRNYIDYCISDAWLVTSKWGKSGSPLPTVHRGTPKESP